MQLYVNDEVLNTEHTRLADLISEIVPAEQRVAVAINQQVVPRSLWTERILCDNDRIDIFESIAGG
ncbi:sulfur carrier protein ThiS [Marinomonas ostreistagni]|uniref:sulfur carrier protein ThiS n=1 Tax=Marinomonas ostreistagni TaxID=359209 RepID=UPI0019518857|nr:sulfur carrier protein ThiS [Marinomonas ostreistagni]MBM6549884.1 sulfur carrier protein ThiS [Marinomonas ostreistagni]